jgi:hypothetical protein
MVDNQHHLLLACTLPNIREGGQKQLSKKKVTVVTRAVAMVASGSGRGGLSRDLNKRYS